MASFNTGKWAVINIFPDSFINLNREMLLHPKLQERLANHPANEWELKFAEIAHYCDIVLDGDYLPEDIERISVILLERLVKLRPKDHAQSIILL